MSGSLGDLVVSLSGDIAKFQSAMSQAEMLAQRSSRVIDTAMRYAGVSLASLGASFSMEAIVNAARQGEESINRLNAVIKATGNQSGYTSEQLHRLADEMAGVTQFDDEAYRDATANLLKFGNLQGDVLKQALKLSADYAAFTKGDVVSATDALGRAFASPAQGVERLQKSIGYLDEAQIRSIRSMQEMGDLAGAQAALMQILTDKVGGTAAAMNTGYTKAIEDAKKATGELMEAIGGSSAVQLATQGALGVITDQAKGLKATIEDGDWLDKYLLIISFGAIKGNKGTALSPVGAGNISPEQAAKQEADRRRAANKAIEEQDKEALKVQKELLKQRTEAAEKETKRRFALAEADLRAEEMFLKDLEEAHAFANKFILDEAEKTAKERAAITAAYIKQEEMFAEDYVEAWKHYNKFVVDQDKKTREENQAQWGGFIGGIESGWRDMWGNVMDGTINSWSDAMDSLKSLFGRTLSDLIYQAYAKPIMLNIVGGIGNMIPGLGGLMGAASNALGNGQTAGFGNIASMFGGGSGSMLTSLGGMIGGSFGSGLAMTGQVGMLQGAMNGFGALMSGNIGAGLGAMIPGIGAAVMAIMALHKMFGDKGENWKGQLGFGGNASAYTSSTAFGTQGFARLAGNDAVNQQIQAFMVGTAGLDNSLARGLSADQIARITGNLTGYNQRTGGGPAEFAFGKDDDTASQQLTLEFLKAKYGVVFDELDKTFADFIRGYTGKSEDLLAEIGKMAGVLDAIAGTDIKGLNLESLRAIAGPDGDLAAVFQSITDNMSRLTDMFASDAQKLATAQVTVEEIFGQLGIAIPQSTAEFYKLIQGIDFSTEAGRALYESLVQVAPAFQQVSQAAANMVNQFNSVMGQIRGPAYSRGILEGQLNTAAQSYLAAVGQTNQFSVQDVLNNIPNIGAADFDWVKQNGGPEAQQALLEVLNLYAQLNQSVSDVNSGFSGLASSTSGLVDSLTQARFSLRDWLDGLFLDKNLSPLSPMQQLEEARRQYESTLGLAKMNDVGAINELGGASQTYLQLARDIFASSPAYNDIFRSVSTSVGGVAGVSAASIESRLAQAIPASGMASSQDMQTLNTSINHLIMIVGNGLTTQDPAARQVLEDIRTALAKPRSGVFAG